MTLDRLMVIAVLGMLATGATVYALTAPPSDAPSRDVDAPAPHPISDEPAPAPSAPSDTAPMSSAPLPAPSDTATASSAPVAPAPSATPSATLLPAPSADASRSVPSPPSAAPTGTTSAEASALIVTGMLSALAQVEAAGMYAEGRNVMASFRPGEILERSFQLIPGKCYKLLAIGLGITELDASFIGPVPGTQLPAVLVQDTSTGARSVVPALGTCYKATYPQATPAKYVIRATAGQGVAAAQLYVK